MADSDNSTTLPFVTRRKILTGTAIVAGALASDVFARDMIENEALSDPVLALWREWQDAHLLMESHGSRLKSLEQQLAETVDYPCAKIELSGGDSVTAYSLTAIREIFDGAPDENVACAKAEAEFAEHQLRWDEADLEIGYSATVRAELEAGDRAANILDVMATTSSTSLAGVEAKLDATLREGNVWEDCSEFPWPQLRSVLNDILRMRHNQSDGAKS
ncbi:hypothetical protein [Brucella pecoris]|uniref:Uncharacterized protein n=1 Tax=Brucella pecoris TaxID=867683 RepID=A0A5C5CC18_9HYPH|nr:hypothetical protein [Brucella pecoris]MBB4096159.1 hypothetical protein [Brucella pecoris]TNV08822.1 hypothetical protein FIB18_23185 [Brucella pecoris]